MTSHSSWGSPMAALLAIALAPVTAAADPVAIELAGHLN